MMYGQMTAGSWIYIGTPGHRSGHLRNVRRGRPPALRRRPRRPLDPDRRAGRHGRRAAAGRGHGGRLVPGRRMPAEPHRDAAAHRLSRSHDRRSGRGAGDHRGVLPRPTAGLGRAARQRGRDPARAAARAACGRTSVTDQTSAHDPVNGYLPAGLDRCGVGSKARARPQGGRAGGDAVDGRACPRRCCEFHRMGVPTVDYGNNIRQRRQGRGRGRRLRLPRLRAGLYPPAVLPRHGPVPLGGAVGRPGGHLSHRRRGEGAAAGRPAPAHLARHGAPSASTSRACRRASAGSGWASGTGWAWRSTRWWRAASSKAPIVIGRDHLDSGSVASPNRETEAMADGSDAVSDWPLLNALLNCASGATWVSLHHGGGVGMGFSQHAGMVIVCDGTEAAAKRIARVLWNDPATGRDAPRRRGLSGCHRLRPNPRPGPAEREDRRYHGPRVGEARPGASPRTPQGALPLGTPPRAAALGTRPFGWGEGGGTGSGLGCRHHAGDRRHDGGQPRPDPVPPPSPQPK